MQFGSFCSFRYSSFAKKFDSTLTVLYAYKISRTRTVPSNFLAYTYTYVQTSWRTRTRTRTKPGVHVRGRTASFIVRRQHCYQAGSGVELQYLISWHRTEMTEP